MEAAPPRSRGRRLRRGTVQRPVDARLVRLGFLVVVPALLAFLFSISTTSALPRFPLDPLFDGASAASFAETLEAQYPSRVPGSDGARDATLWYRETVSALGLKTEEDVWTDDLAGLGEVELRNIVTVVAGRTGEAVVLVAHRDNAGTEEPYGENASGTAALIELARGFTSPESGADPVPQHTLVLVSTDAGAFGGAGATRFVETSPFAQEAIAVVVLDRLDGVSPRLAIAGDRPVSPARPLVRTAALRVAEEAGVTPQLPSVPSQLVALGLPFALTEQGRFLGQGLSAVTLTTSPDAEPGADRREQRLGQLGRATEALVSSLDASVSGAFRTPDSLYFSDRAASGWTARLALVVAIVPFALGLVDLVARSRRRRLPFRPALRAQRARLGLWLTGAALVWVGAVLGVLPSGASLPLAPYASLMTDTPVLALLGLASAFGVAWLVVRDRLAHHVAPAADERLAGLVVSLMLLGVVALIIAATQPYALVFVLPSLYAWLWLPVEGRLAARAALFVVGLVGPLAGLLVLGSTLDMSPFGAALYLVGLTTVGYLSWSLALLGVAWLAAAAQVGAVALDRYAPYAGGVEPPPPGPVRRLLSRGG